MAYRRAKRVSGTATPVRVWGLYAALAAAAVLAGIVVFNFGAMDIVFATSGFYLRRLPWRQPAATGESGRDLSRLVDFHVFPVAVIIAAAVYLKVAA